jgi:hypothetical protein
MRAMTSNIPADYNEQDWYHEPEDDEYMICPTCDGLGTDNWDDEKLCWRCMGEGEILVLG